MPTPLMSAAAARVPLSALALPIVMMGLVVLASNILVQHPITAFGLQDWLTFGAFTYPFAFLVTDLSNRRFGAAATRKVVYIGFVVALVLSAIFATPRIAIASGTAFLAAQLVDVSIFQALRERVWWLPPLASTVVASALDTAIFFSFAFHCDALPLVGGTISGLLGTVGIADQCLALPWQTLALADYGVKLLMAAICLLPYGLAQRRIALAPAAR